MRNGLINILLFLTAMVLQLFVFDSLHLGIYISPLVYVAFIILLPVNTKPVVVLLMGLITGILMDFFSGMGGLHTVVTLFTAYVRHFIMIVTIGRENMEEGGMPSSKLLGRGRFMRYISFMVAVHCLVFFTLEALNWKYYYFVLLKAVVSGAVTLLFVWLISLVFTVKTRKKA